jgi:hypothetical protein
MTIFKATNYVKNKQKYNKSKGKKKDENCSKGVKTYLRYFSVGADDVAIKRGRN